MMTMAERTTKTVVNVAKMKNFIFGPYLSISVQLKVTTKFVKMNYLATEFGKHRPIKSWSVILVCYKKHHRPGATWTAVLK